MPLSKPQAPTPAGILRGHEVVINTFLGRKPDQNGRAFEKLPPQHGTIVEVAPGVRVQFSQVALMNNLPAALAAVRASRELVASVLVRLRNIAENPKSRRLYYLGVQDVAVATFKAVEPSLG